MEEPPDSMVSAAKRNAGLYFEPINVMPEQFFPERDLSPEENVRKAMLEQALHEYQKPPYGKRAVAAEALQWLLDDDQKYCLTFRNICEVLGLDPHSIRRAFVTGDENGHVIEFKRGYHLTYRPRDQLGGPQKNAA
jgi:hypothetical protein